MQLLAAGFVGKPLVIALVALAFFAAWLTLRTSRSKPDSTPLLIAAAWALYAAWEWLVLVRTPHADIRVDLLLIWPVVGLLSLWALFRAFRQL